MSYGYSSSFNSNNGFSQTFSTPYVSSQSTEYTEVSEFGNAGRSARQSNNATAEEALFQNVGYGAGQSGTAANNAATPFGNSYEFPTANSTTTGAYQERSAYEAPWTGLPLLHQFDPNPSIQRSSASRSWQLDYSARTMYNVPNPATSLTPSGSNAWANQQSTGMNPFNGILSLAVSPQSTSPPASHAGKLLIERLPRTPGRRGTGSNDAEPERSWCSQCNFPFSRPDVLARHVRDCHDEAETGPYWLCHICDHWTHNARQDKMREHYLKKHNRVLEKGECPYSSVQSVGVQEHVARVSNNGKRTRRRKRHVT